MPTIRSLLLCCICLFLILPAHAQDSLIDSVCLITDVGTVTDGTFNQYAHDGMIRAVDDFELEFIAIETQVASDYAANVEVCVSEQYDAIITVGFSLGEVTTEAARANPDRFFIGVDQFYDESAPENVVGLQFREDQGGFLAGVMAALMTETGVVAGVYGQDLPPVKRFRSGYEQGVAYIDEGVQTLGIYIDSFVSPGDGAAAAAAFIEQGADVIFGAGGMTGSGAIAFAAEEGVYVIGVDQDEYFTTFGFGLAPGADRLLTSAVKRVDNGVYTLLEGLEAGEPFSASVFVLSAENGGIIFAPSHDAPVPDEVLERLDGVLDMLATGELETGVDPITGDLVEIED